MKGRITGSIEDLGVIDIVQTLTLGTKTACLSLTREGQSGQIWFEEGRPVHALTSTLKGETAFCEMVCWNSGEFVIESGAVCSERTLTQDATYLLMEAIRLMDESYGPGAEAPRELPPAASEEPVPARPDRKAQWTPLMWGLGAALVLLIILGTFVVTGERSNDAVAPPEVRTPVTEPVLPDQTSQGQKVKKIQRAAKKAPGKRDASSRAVDRVTPTSAEPAARKDEGVRTPAAGEPASGGSQ